MDIEITFTEDPRAVLSRAGTFLASRPILHNLILTLLHERIARSEPGRYWVAMAGEAAVGVVVQSPLTFPATLTPMEPQVVAAMVDAIARAGISLPGLNGEAATAASFAGHWTERCNSAAIPYQGNRLYELGEIGRAPGVGGKLRLAVPTERDLMIDWTHAFQVEVGQAEAPDMIARRMNAALADQQVWLWEDGAPKSMAVSREAVEGVVRIAGVYTPPESRRHGYAAAGVHALSKHFRNTGLRCILYTDLHNPTSNSIYRRIGYQAVAEALRYRFEQREA